MSGIAAPLCFKHFPLQFCGSHLSISGCDERTMVFMPEATTVFVGYIMHKHKTANSIYRTGTAAASAHEHSPLLKLAGLSLYVHIYIYNIDTDMDIHSHLISLCKKVHERRL